LRSAPCQARRVRSAGERKRVLVAVSDRFEALPESEYAALRAARWSILDEREIDGIGIATDGAGHQPADTLVETEPSRERFVKEEQDGRE
jgi:hypothetical protein